jgi:hypothetical protein
MMSDVLFVLIGILFFLATLGLMAVFDLLMERR